MEQSAMPARNREGRIGEVQAAWVPIGPGGSMPRRRRRRFQLRLNARAARLLALGFVIALIAVSVGCVVYERTPQPQPDHLPPAQRLVEPIDALTCIEGWIPSWADEAALVQQAAQAGFTGLLFFHGSVKADGKVSLEDPKGLQAGVDLANARELTTWLTVTNHGSDLGGALASGRTDAHVESLLAAWRKSGCGHLDLDYESLTLSQLKALESCIEGIVEGLGNARLSLTLQPADGTLRPDQLPVYRRLLANRNVACLRLMAYDYHWKGSLPGALCPLPAFERLIEAYPEYRSKLVMCLPLYGYDWARPQDATIPTASTITLRDLPNLSGPVRAVWMRQDAELALEYGGTNRHWVAAPSLRAVRQRVQVMLQQGVPGVCFWHLGCASLAAVAKAARDPETSQPEAFETTESESWRQWQQAFKQRVCDTVTARPGDTLESIGRAAGVERAAMFRFNEDLTNDGLAGKTVYVPR